MAVHEIPDATRGGAIISADRPALMVFVADEASEAAIRGAMIAFSTLVELQAGQATRPRLRWLS